MCLTAHHGAAVVAVAAVVAKVHCEHYSIISCMLTDSSTAGSCTQCMLLLLQWCVNQVGCMVLWCCLLVMALLLYYDMIMNLNQSLNMVTGV
jgi:hypothetical protein